MLLISEPQAMLAWWQVFWYVAILPCWLRAVKYKCHWLRASLVAQLVKKSACNVGDLGSIPGLERSPGERKGYPLQCSGLENSRDCIVHGLQRVGHS